MAVWRMMVRFWKWAFAPVPPEQTPLSDDYSLRREPALPGPGLAEAPA